MISNINYVSSDILWKRQKIEITLLISTKDGSICGEVTIHEQLQFTMHEIRRIKSSTIVHLYTYGGCNTKNYEKEMCVNHVS